MRHSETSGIKGTKTVWIVNEGGHNYEPASKLGSLVPLTKGTVNVFRPDRLAHEIAVKLKSAKEDDYVMISGPPIVFGIVLALWFIKFPVCYTLQWSHKKEIYEVRAIQRAGLESLVKEYW